MDHNPPDDASEHAPPSEHAELISNLSTMPNISQQNDPNIQQAPYQQEPNPVPTVIDHQYPTYSQQLVNLRSQSLDQGVNHPSSHFSAPPYLNQFVSQEGRKNQQVSNPATSSKPGRLSCFDEEWQRTFKAEQDKREQEYQNHVLLNQDNEPLLSQNYDPVLSQNHEPIPSQHHQPLPSQNQDYGHDISFSQNQPLLSQNSVLDHEQIQNFDNEPLLSQPSQINQELQSIHESNEDGKSSNASNEVKYQLFQPINEVFFNEDSRSQCSSRALSQPLFQMKVNDESQSNLLKFGFSVSKKDKNVNEDNHFIDPHNDVVPDHEEIGDNQIVKVEIPMDIQSYPQEEENHYTNTHSDQKNHQNNDGRQEDNSSPSANVQIPMDIESYPLVQVPEIIDEPSNNVSQDRIIKIQVNDCPSQNINSSSKNNDIYGIDPHQQNHEKSNPSKHQEQINRPPELIKESSQELQAHQQDWTKKDEKQEQIKQQDSISLQQQQKNGAKDDIKNTLNQCLQVIADFVPNLPELHPLTLEEIVKQIDVIVNSDVSGQQKTEKGSKLLKEHIDLWFITPISQIGQQIMSNGETAVNLIKIMLAKQTDNDLKQVLQKYLLLTFAKKIIKNQSALFEYQQSIVPVIKQRMTQNATQPRPFESSRENEPSIVIHQTQETQLQVPNESIHAQNGSSSKKYEVQAMDIVGQKEPIKRTVKTKNIISVNPTLQSGKVTRKTRQKGRTQAKATVVKFDDDKNQAQESNNEQPRSPEIKSRKKGNSKSVGKRPNSLKKGQSQEQTEAAHLGSKFTFVLRENNKSHEKVLVQKRVSQRLASKQSARNSTSKSNQRKPSLRKGSSTKKYEEEEVDLDFIKQNCDVIRVISALGQDQFEALTQRDQVIADLFRQCSEIAAEEEEYSNSHRSQENQEVNNVQAQDHTAVSVHSARSMHSQASLMARKLQFKKNIAKYKPGDIPTIIERVVDPDINGHGIYALLELGKLSRFVHNARFALTPITSLSRALKTLIDQDYEQARRQVGEEQKNNLVYIKPNVTILDMIKAENERRARGA